MDLLQIHTDLLFLANKEQSFWPRETIDSVLHMAQMWKYNDCLRRYAVDQEAQDDLAPFKDKFEFTNLSTVGGLIDLSAKKYGRLVGLWVQYLQSGRIRRTGVEILNEAQLGDRLDSQLEPVSLNSPVATMLDYGKIQLHPSVPSAGYVYFIKIPVAPKMSYTIEEDRTFNYNQSNSEQMLWNDTCIFQIIIKSLQLLGVNIDNDRLIGYTEQKDLQKP